MKKKHIFQAANLVVDRSTHSSTEAKVIQETFEHFFQRSDPDFDFNLKHFRGYIDSKVTYDAWHI